MTFPLRVIERQGDTHDLDRTAKLSFPEVFISEINQMSSSINVEVLVFIFHRIGVNSLDYGSVVEHAFKTGPQPFRRFTTLGM